jgi:hypothetical protein
MVAPWLSMMLKKRAPWFAKGLPSTITVVAPANSGP